jgi:hypothetical protein
MTEILFLAFITGVLSGLVLDNVVFPLMFGVWLRLARNDRGR